MLQDMIGDLSNAPEPMQIKLFSPTRALLARVGAAGRRRDLESSMVWSTC